MSAFDPKRTSTTGAAAAPPPMWAELFSCRFVHIYVRPTVWGRISAPVAASINAAMKGVVSEQTRRKGDIVTNSKEVLKKRADARFKKDERVREGTKAILEYEAEGRAVREKTARLRALRLDKEAAEKNEGVAPDSGEPLVARKKANHGC
jgi:hypothetical protein